MLERDTKPRKGKTRSLIIHRDETFEVDEEEGQSDVSQTLFPRVRPLEILVSKAPVSPTTPPCLPLFSHFRGNFDRLRQAGRPFLSSSQPYTRLKDCPEGFFCLCTPDVATSQGFWRRPCLLCGAESFFFINVVATAENTDNLTARLC